MASNELGPAGFDLERLVAALEAIPRVEAVVLGGSRAQGRERPDSDWDIGIYYRGELSGDSVRALGYEGTVVEPGEWGPMMNGGAWLDIEGHRVDVLYRDLDVVWHATREAVAGRFQTTDLLGYLAGFPSYTLMGEASLSRVLAGRLDRFEFPEALVAAADRSWRFRRDFHVTQARVRAERGERALATGMLVRAALEEAHGRMLERREWTLNEKGLLERVGLGEVAELLVTGAPAAPPGSPALVDLAAAQLSGTA